MLSLVNVEPFHSCTLTENQRIQIMSTCVFLQPNIKKKKKKQEYVGFPFPIHVILVLSSSLVILFILMLLLFMKKFGATTRPCGELCLVDPWASCGTSCAPELLCYLLHLLSSFCVAKVKQKSLTSLDQDLPICTNSSSQFPFLSQFR